MENSPIMETAISSATIQLAGFLRSTPHPLKDGASVRVLPPRPQSRNAPAVQIMRTPMMAKTPRQSVNMRPACASRGIRIKPVFGASSWMATALPQSLGKTSEERVAMPAGK